MRAEYLTDSELAALRANLSPTEWLPLEIALQTGMRIGDVLKIKPCDIVNGGVKFIAQKTKKRGWAELTNEQIKRLRLQAKYGWCFPSPKKAGKHLTRQAAWQRIKRASKRANINPDGVSPHSTRKVFGVKTANVDGVAEAMRKLQHESREVNDIYILSDWTTGNNANLPLLRKDLPKIIDKLLILLARP